MSLSRTGSIDPFRRAMHDVFDSMERDLVAPSGMSSRFHTMDFPLSSVALVSAVPSMGREGGLAMNLDFHETNNGYELSADLPGMKKENIKVDIDSESGVLTVTGERKQEREEKSEGDNEQRKYHFVERSYGKTTRTVRLPDTADTSKARAAYVNGVLKLNFPKREPLSARRRQIHIGDGE
uniref:Heat shock protein 20 n=1 Tax=Fucus serratus TaxID=87148 RepID=B3VMZ9_FUCSE|nr:heat shock protein 20 [Fucus serratus]